MVGSPVAHHEPLETKLILQEIVQSVAVLAAIAVVDPAWEKQSVIAQGMFLAVPPTH